MHGLTLGAGVGGHAAAGAGGPPPGTQFVGAGPLGYPGMCVIGAGAGYASLPNIEAQVGFITRWRWQNAKKNWSEDLEIHQHKYLTPLIRFDITFLIDLNYSILRCSRTLDLHLQLLPLMRVRLGVVDSSQREDSPTRVSLCQLTRTVNTFLQRLPAHHQPHPPDTWLSRGPPTHSHTPVTTATPTRSNWLHLWLSSFTVSSVFFNILPGLYLL